MPVRFVVCGVESRLGKVCVNAVNEAGEVAAMRLCATEAADRLAFAVGDVVDVTLTRVEKPGVPA